MLTAELTAPGGWLAAVIPGRLAVVQQPQQDAAFASRLWGALAGDDGLRGVLDQLAGKGLAATPAFVLVEWDAEGRSSDARFIVRGEAGIAIDSEAGREDLSARGVSTWVERPVGGVLGFRIECRPGTRGTALPLVAGCAWVEALSFGSSAGDFTSLPNEVAAPIVDDFDRTIADLEGTIGGLAPDDAPSIAAEAAAGSYDRATRDPDLDVPHETTGYDHLFGATLMRPVEEAAARPVQEDAEADQSAGIAIPPAPLAAPQSLGDHDGLTVLSGDLRALRESTASENVENVPGASEHVVGADEEPGFTLQLPDGRSEPIDGMVVVGRAPSVSKMGGGRIPRLVTVDSLEHDISRNHVQLTVEGGTVVVTDLHSRNGTLIALPGKSPQKLRAGEPTSVIAGTVIDLGSGVTLGVAQA